MRISSNEDKKERHVKNTNNIMHTRTSKSLSPLSCSQTHAHTATNNHTDQNTNGTKKPMSSLELNRACKGFACTGREPVKGVPPADENGDIGTSDRVGQDESVGTN